MATTSGYIDAIGYLVVRQGPPRNRRSQNVGARIVSVTQQPPATLPLGSVALKVRIRVPREVFQPALAEAVVTVPAQDVIVPEVTVEGGEPS